MLVVRSYIQGENYQNDIRNLTLVGTPNKGAAFAYIIWEGGNPIFADSVKGGNGFGVFAKYFYTNTINENYQEITEKSGLCIWEFGVSDTPIACNKEKVYDFVHKNVLSLGQLMPIYEGAIYRYPSMSEDITSTLIERNEFLFVLNNGGTYKGETYSLMSQISNLVSKFNLYASYSEETLYKIGVGIPNPSSVLYKDGEIIATHTTPYGDGTVASGYSVNINNILALGLGGEHSSLITKLIPFINDLIN